ncbi:hypothetical protein ACFW04_001982 [Cataglyphis niger]
MNAHISADFSRRIFLDFPTAVHAPFSRNGTRYFTLANFHGVLPETVYIEIRINAMKYRKCGFMDIRSTNRVVAITWLLRRRPSLKSK